MWETTLRSSARKNNSLCKPYVCTVSNFSFSVYTRITENKSCLCASNSWRLEWEHLTTDPMRWKSSLRSRSPQRSSFQLLALILKPDWHEGMSKEVLKKETGESPAKCGNINVRELSNCERKTYIKLITRGAAACPKAAGLTVSNLGRGAMTRRRHAIML